MFHKTRRLGDAIKLTVTDKDFDHGVEVRYLNQSVLLHELPNFVRSAIRAGEFQSVTLTAKDGSMMTFELAE